MKFLVVVLTIVGSVAAADWTPKTDDEIKAVRLQCLEANPLSAETMQKLWAFETPDEEAVRNLILCVVSNLGYFSDVEGYYPDRIVKQFQNDLSESEALAIVQACVDKNEQNSSADVWAFRGDACLMQTKIGESIRESIKKAHAA